MADELMTLDDMADGKLDLKTIAIYTSGDENVVNEPRLAPGVNVGSLAALNKHVKDKVDLQMATLPAGRKGYTTLALAQAAQATLAANTLVEVTNDTTTANNGVYLWDGSALTKSAYDVLTSAKAYVDLKLVSFTERSGYIAGVLTSDNKILMAFRKSDGLPVFANGQSSLDVIEALNTSFQSKFEVSASGRSGVLYGLKTLDGSLPFYIDIFSGAPIFCGVDILAAIRNIESNRQNIEPNIQLFPDDALVGWGDSLTGAGSSGDWLQKLANQIGWSYYNGGIGGQGSKQIASRSGAVPARFTQEFVIPATTTPITVSVNEWTPCSRGGDAQLIKVKGITGQLSRSNKDVHTFVRSEAGVEVNVNAGSYAYSANGDMYSKRFLIVGTGRNSISTMQPYEIVATVKAMIDGQKTQIKRAIVWSVPYFPSDSVTQKQRIDDINTALRNTFPEYFVDIAGWLCSSSPVLFGTTTINDPFTVLGITPTSQDLTDISNKLTPISLRTSETDGHFNQNCGTAIAYRMKRELEIKGWI